MRKQYIFILLLNIVLCQTDSLWTEVSGDTVTIHHDNTIRNCGAQFDLSPWIYGNNIVVINEIDTGEVTFCSCQFDLEITISGFFPGTWTVYIYGQDLENDGDSVYYGNVQFTIVEDNSAPFQILNEYQGPCDSNSAYLGFLDLFPIHVGDKWQYFTTGWEMYETHTYYRTITVTGEIVMPNNERYFITDFWPLGYVRVDSLEQTVYVYNSSLTVKN